MEIIQNLISGIIGLSLLLFSSYQGNNPKIDNFTYFYTKDYLAMDITISNAYEKDFYDFFKSTVPIKIICNINLKKSDGTEFYKKNFIYTVTYKTETKLFELSKNDKLYYIDNFQRLKKELSEFKTEIFIKNPELLKLTVKIYPAPIKINKKTFNMILLWKNKIISYKRILIPRIYEN